MLTILIVRSLITATGQNSWFKAKSDVTKTGLMDAIYYHLYCLHRRPIIPTDERVFFRIFLSSSKGEIKRSRIQDFSEEISHKTHSCITFILSHTCTPRQNGVSCNYVIFVSRSEGQLCEEVWKTVWCLHEACKVLREAWKPFFHTTSWCTVSCVWSQIQQRSSFNSYRTVVIENITVLMMFYLCLYRSSVTMCM